MCARFYRLQELQKFYLRFKLQQALAVLTPQYNIAPTDKALVIPATKGPRQAVPMNFGLTNPWKPGSLLVNMRTESFAAKPAFKLYLQRQRCLIPADGFFEWRRAKSGSIPFSFSLADGDSFGLAGIFDNDTFAIITTEPNSLVAPVHSRMPVILRREEEDLWLDARVTEYHKLVPLLSPYPPSAMVSQELSSAVNSPQNKGPEILQSRPKVTPPPAGRSNQGELF